jgi:hypothetical protein
MVRLRLLAAGIVMVTLALLLAPGRAAGQTVVHVSMVSHNETDDARYGFLENEQGYLALRGAILQIAGLMTEYGAAWSHQSDWRFLQAVRTFDHGAVLNNTNGKNILRYLHEDLGFEIDAHSHESGGYNYADVAYLLEDLGIPSTHLVGGFIYSPPDSPAVSWEKFRSPLQGLMFPAYSWQAEYLWGGGTINHQGQDANVAGCWRPQDECHFFEHDSLANLINIGHGSLLPQLIQDINSGAAPAGKLYTQSLMVFELDVMNRGQAALSEIEATLQMVQGYVQSGAAQWTPLTEMARIWQEDFHAEPFSYPEIPVIPCSGLYTTEVVEGYLVTAPNGNSLWVQIRQPRRDLYPNERFPVVVCVPGGLGAGEHSDKGYASSGFIEVHFNAEGRGVDHPSQGVENHNGFIHQDDLKAVIQYAHDLPNGIPEQLGVQTGSYGITMGAGCLGRYPELPVKYLLDVEGPDESYVTSFEPWTLDGNPANDRQQVAYNMFGHWSTTRDPSPQNFAWWQEREALRYIGQVSCAYLRVQAAWDHAQPPNQQWPGFDYPPLWYPCKHTVDMVNAAVAGTAPWVRVNGSSLGNLPNSSYSRETPPVYYSETFSAHPGEELTLIRELVALNLNSSGAADGRGPAGPTLTAFPNPAGTSAQLRYGLGAADRVRCEIFDLQGRRVRTFALGRMGAGRHALDWDGRDQANRQLPSAVYLVRLLTSAGIAEAKVVLLH